MKKNHLLFVQIHTGKVGNCFRLMYHSSETQYVSRYIANELTPAPPFHKPTFKIVRP